MSAAILREAAELMRERAEAARPSPWVQNGRNGIHTQIGQCIATTHSHDDGRRKAEAQHIASWHPAVALAVADWLEATAADWDGSRAPVPVADLRRDARCALDVARAYLGRDT